MAGTGGKDQDKEGGLGQTALKSNAAVAALAMKGADAWQRVVVYGCYLIALISIVAVLSPPYEAAKQVICVFVIVVPLFTAVVFVLIRYRQLSGVGSGCVNPPPPTAAPTDIVLATATRDRMFQLLEEARRLVFDTLRQKQRALEDGQVRANIFFPEYRSGGSYLLKIRPGLHIQMSGAELGITLKAGQGLTGKVFQTGEPRVAQRVMTEPTGWELVYRITPDLAEIIHPELRWIVSMPLKGAGNRPIGVMNIDGLTHQFDVDDLYACARRLTVSAIVLAGLAAGN
jgi:hypothetical protein